MRISDWSSDVCSSDLSLRTVADRPCPGMGPLGGLAGALRHAGDHGFDLVLTAACDMPDIPPGLVERLGPAPSVVKGQQLVGLWPASLAAVLEAHLDETGDNSVKAWMGRRSEEHTSEL